MHFHEDVGAGVGRGLGRSGEMAKAELLVEMNGGRGFGVGLEIEAAGAHTARFGKGELEEAAADAAAADRFRDGHFGELEFAGRDGDESAAADGHAGRFGDADLAAGSEDVRLRITEHLMVMRLEDEVFADPVFVEAEEGGFVAGAEGAEDDVVGRVLHTRRLARRRAIAAAEYIERDETTASGRFTAAAMKGRPRLRRVVAERRRGTCGSRCR